MILVTGSLAFDFIMNFSGRFSDHIMPDKIHLLNLSFLADKLNKNFGGCGGNIAYNLALLGNEPYLLSSVGKDFSEYQKFLGKAGVNTSYVRKNDNDFTANYFVVVDKADNQIGGFYAGAMSNDKNLSLKEVKEKINFLVISPTYPEAMLNFSQEAKKMAIPYLFDPGMQLPRFKDQNLEKAIKGAEILIGNDYEIALIKKKFSGLPKVKILITTLGEKGSLIKSNSKVIKIPVAKAKKVCDPVGAGDAYRAGFLAGYLKGFDLKTCGQMGAVAAVYTVEKYGTTTHRFTKKQFCDRYKANFKVGLDL